MLPIAGGSPAARASRIATVTAGRPAREIAAVCDLVTPDRTRQLRVVQCEEKRSS